MCRLCRDPLCAADFDDEEFDKALDEEIPEHDCWEHAESAGLGLLECRICYAIFDRFGRYDD